MKRSPTYGADSPAGESLRVPPKAAQAAFSIPSNKKTRLRGLILFGGVDGTRTRDPRRDRPVF